MPRPPAPRPVPVRAMLPAADRRSDVFVIWMPMSLRPVLPPVPVIVMSPPPASKVALLVWIAREKPVATPDGLASSVIGAPFEVSTALGVTTVQLMQMFWLACRSMPLPAPPLTVAESFNGDGPARRRSSRCSGAVAPMTPEKVALPVVVAPGHRGRRSSG